MKKSLFLVPLALGLFACSNDNLVDNPGQNPDASDGDLSYLSINISGVGNSSTRADDHDEDHTYTDGVDSSKHPYADGRDDEWTVNKVCFYFFDEQFQVANVVNGDTYYTTLTNLTASTEGNTENPNVTALTNAEIVLTTGGNSSPAAYILAIVNPTPALEGATITKYDDILKLEAVVKTESYGDDTNGFLMSNSAFVDAGAVCDLVDITGKVFTSREAAKGSPAQIYVERVAAKASVEVYENENLVRGTVDNVYKLTAPAAAGDGYLSLDGNDFDTAVDELYVKFLGWNVTATPDQSYAIKNLSTDWTTTGPWSTPNWNVASNFRSYWGINSGIKDQYNYASFYDNSNAETAQTKFAYDDDDSDSYAYMHENAFVPTVTDIYELDDEGEATTTYTARWTAQHFPTDPTTATTTKLIVCGQICDADGNPQSFAEYAGDRFPLTTTKGHTTLYKAMANLSGIYVRTGLGTVESPYVYTSLGDWTDFQSSLLDLVPYQDLDETLKGYVDGLSEGLLKDQNYYSYAKYAELQRDNFPGSESPFVFTAGCAENAPVLTLEGFNERLINYAGPAKVWQDGMTYYFVEIQHLNKTLKSALGYFGVVRNHWYETTITAIQGLGTPVLDGNQVIYPQVPQDDPWSYLAADIRILSWHKVQNNVVLGEN